MRSDPAETKVFDPADGFAPLTDVREVTDPTVFKRSDRWCMCVATEVANRPGIQLATASLPEAAPLSSSGWRLTAERHDATRIAVLPQERSRAWDLEGGRHCPSYVNGWDPHTQRWVERIYYAGGAEHLWGPYTIGYLEWHDEGWIDSPAPVFVATEAWEHGSVYEPNVIYANEKWKLWYVAGSNYEDYLVHGYAESEDGRSNWTPHQIFAPADMKMFDFHVFQAGAAYEAVFSRVSLRGMPSAYSGLWLCRCDRPSPRLADWSNPVQIMTAADRGWHSGPWKPTTAVTADPDKLLVFFSGAYSRQDGSPFPFVFTLGCLELPPGAATGNIDKRDNAATRDS
jgi:hypothetical protein